MQLHNTMHSQRSSGAGMADVHRRPQRRKRVVISCNECHRRKQKCDRRQPCANCTKRDKVSLCFYAMTEPEPARAGHASVPRSMGGQRRTSMPQAPDTPSVDNSPSSQSRGTISPISATTGTANDPIYPITSASGTLSVLEQASKSEQHAREARSADDAALPYRNLARQLPPRTCIDVLVRGFFVDVAWHSDVVNQAIFEEQLAEWYRVPYLTLSRGPKSMSPETRLFPALLFQVLAQALLYRPVCRSDSLGDLKYAPGMTFVDLAIEYSDAGSTMMTMLGNGEANMTTLQAGLLRALFQRSIGSVVEAWNSLRSTIRDAREVGLDCIEIGPQDLAVASPELLRALEAQRKMWLVLHLWDGHMSMALGRTMSTKLDHAALALSLDAIYDMEAAVRGEAELLWAERHQPTPFAMLLWLFHTAGRHLQNMSELDRAESAPQERYALVQEASAAIVDSTLRLPDWARVDNANTDWDHVPSCSWLPAAREMLDTQLYSVLLALHRPFIFSVRASRNQALLAALRVLASQGRLLDRTGPREHAPFDVVFATFDAIVLVCAICSMYPHENAHHVDNVVRSLEGGVARLRAMRARNKMASTAHAMAQTMYERLRRRLAAAAADTLLAPPGSLAPGPVRQGDSTAASTAAYGHDAGFSQPLAFVQGFEELLTGPPLQSVPFQHPPMSAQALSHAPLADAGMPMSDDFWRPLDDPGS